MIVPKPERRRLTATRVVALAVIGVLGVGLGWLRFAPEQGPMSVPSGAMRAL